MRSRLNELFGIDVPVVQAPMAGSAGAELAVAVCEAGGLGSLPCALLRGDAVRAEVGSIRARTAKPFNLNFFCHADVEATDEQMAAWTKRLAPYYSEFGIPTGQARASRLAPFGQGACAVVEQLRPAVVSFHFGLPTAGLVERVKAAGATVMSSATSVAEACWLVDHGCDVVIAQGLEAGGHRGMFLDQDVARQVGTIALVPQIVDAVDVPVIAAGGIADARGVVAALALGADGVQVGTALLRTPEARTVPLHRQALAGAAEDSTAITNVLSGRPARSIVNRAVAELGPWSDLAPPFPLPTGVMAPLRAAAEQAGLDAFTPLWSGQAAALGRELPAGDLVRQLSAGIDALLLALPDRLR
jgi:nitronate monooxygenase